MIPMSKSEKNLGNIVRRVPTGIFVTPDEVKLSVQLYGAWQDNKTEANWNIHLEYFQRLAAKHNLKWFEHELAPNGEFILVVRDTK